MTNFDRSTRAATLLKSSLLILPMVVAGCGGSNSDSADAKGAATASTVTVGAATPNSTDQMAGTATTVSTDTSAAATAATDTASTATAGSTGDTSTTSTTTSTTSTTGTPGSSGNTAAPAVCAADDPVTTQVAYATSMPAADPKAVVHKYFTITVRDAATTLPIPGVKLKINSKQSYTSDDNGVVAFYEPGLMDHEVWFTPSRDGYTVPADWLGIRGAKLKAVEGASGTINLTSTGASTAISSGNLQSRMAAGNVPGKDQCMTIRVFDQKTQRGVPLVGVQLSTGTQYSDSQGIVAYCNPDGMGTQTLAFSSHGYTSKSVAVQVAAGGVAQVALERNNIAERLYRITGQGIYRDSLLLGMAIPIENGGLRSQVVGQDSVISAVYKNQIMWTWGDTDNVSYALGNFSSPAATSLLPTAGGLDAARGVDITYLGNPSGFVKSGVSGIEPTSNPTWIGAMVAVPDKDGNERLFASFSKAASDMSSLKLGLIQFDDTAQAFKPVIEDYPLSGDTSFPSGGQAFKFKEPGGEYAYFKGGKLRIPATAEAMVDRSTYEVYTPLVNGSTTQLDRVGDVLQYKWRKGALGLDKVDTAISSAGVSAGQKLGDHMRNVVDAGGIGMVSTSITWNEYRGRFVMIGGQKYGSPSMLGEIWYAEADTPMGPWVDARKIVTHNDYTFYNPYTHPYLSKDKGKTIFFEGTYTKSFSSAPTPTPLYDYNQMMYRIDVDDANLILPVPIYDQGTAIADRFSAKNGVAPGTADLAAPFLALDRPSAATLAIGWNAPACDSTRRLVSGSSVVDPLFYAMPSSATAPLKSMVALYEYAHPDGRRVYAVDAAQVPSGFVRAASSLAWVWSNPVKAALPVGNFRGNLVVNAGADQCVVKGTAATAAVTVNAASVRKGSGGALSYRWRVPASQVTAEQCLLVSGATATLHLAAGTHKIVLEGSDAAGNISKDTMVVRVQ